MDTQKQNKWMLRAAFASISTVVVLIVLKAVAFAITGSVAMLSSLFDSIQDSMTSVVNLVAIRHAVIPADKHHRFGHGKAQGVGSLIQACIIIMAALFLAKESVVHIVTGQGVTDISIGIWVSICAIVLTGALITFQTWVIKQTNSLCVRTDKAHYVGDILMNLGVLLSLMASSCLGWRWLDGVFGIGVSCYLIYSVCNVVREALAMLMDHELPEKTRQTIKSVALSVPKVLNVSNLKTRQSGSHLFIQFDVQFDGKMQLNSAHRYLDEIESKLHQLYPECDVMIHAEPFIDKLKTGDKK